MLPIEYEDEWEYEPILEYFDNSGAIDEQIAKLSHGIYLKEWEDEQE
jgi:hypothetical protein